MAAEAVRLRRANRGRGNGGGGNRGALRPSRGLMGGLLALPVRWIAVAMVVLLVLLAGVGFLLYRSFDSLYPQSIRMYFRPESPVGDGSVLFRTQDGQLFVAPVAAPNQARRLLDTAAVASGAGEFVRDGVALPNSRSVAYFATQRVAGQPESDHIKVVPLDGGAARDISVTAAAGEALRPAIFVSESGRYLAVTSKDRSRIYYLDLSGDSAVMALGTLDAPPERMQWNRNGDLQTPVVAGQRAFAASPDGKLRAQVRAGSRRAPECGEDKCEAVQELVVMPGTIAGSARPPVVIYGAFSQFSADGWGPIPVQPAQKLYGRLVWSPDGKELLFSTLDGADIRTYAITVDGRTQPHLILDQGEALDWLP